VSTLPPSLPHHHHNCSLSGLLLHVPSTVLSHVDFADAVALRATCRAGRAGVAAVDWSDRMRDAAAVRDVARWCACFPSMTAAKLHQSATDDDLIALARGCPRLTNLTVSACLRFTDAGLRAFGGRLRRLEARACRQSTFTDAGLSCLTGLTHLDVTDCCQRSITGVGIQALSAHLTELKIAGCVQRSITDAAVSACTRLTALDISDCAHLTDAAFAGLSNLVHVSIRNCPLLSDRTVRHLARCPLEALLMDGCTGISGAGLRWLSSGRLQTLSMSGCSQLGDDALAAVGGTLRHLYACQCPLVTDAGLAHLAKVEVLDVSDNCGGGITDVGLKHLPARTLESLDISGCHQVWVTDAGLSHLVNVRALSIARCGQPGMTGKFLANMPRLQTLDASSCTHLHPANLRHAVTLRNLDVSNCRLMDDVGLAPLTKLEQLDVSGCTSTGLTDVSLAGKPLLHTLNMAACGQATLTDAAFEGLHALRSLSISRCEQFSSDIFRHMPQLLTLHVGNCRQAAMCDAGFKHIPALTTLHVCGCTQSTLTDAVFASLPALRKVCMSNCAQMTDGALHHLRRVTWLSISGCRRITDAGLAELTGIGSLFMSSCCQAGITDAGVACVAGRASCLHMDGCHQLTDAALAPALPMGAVVPHTAPQAPPPLVVPVAHVAADGNRRVLGSAAAVDTLPVTSPLSPWWQRPALVELNVRGCRGFSRPMLQGLLGGGISVQHDGWGR